MPMSVGGMKSALNSAVQAIPGINITSQEELSAYHEALATAIVGYITGNALVTGNVTSGVGSGGTVTGGIS